jgi:hypothetical protein
MRRFVASHLLRVGAVLLIASASGFADQILFERDLPSNNINGPSGIGRSNYAPVVQGTTGLPDPNNVPFILGDDFSLSGTGGFLVNTLTLYVVLQNPGDSLTQEISGLTLYGGADSGTIGVLSSLPTFTRVQYNGTTDYQSTASPTTFTSIYAVTFTNLNWSVVGGVDYDFALGATMIGNNTLAISASNMATSGGVQDPNPLGGTDGSYIEFFGGTPPTLSYAPFPTVPQDLNVVISGVNLSNNGNTPEPTTFAMMGLGGLILVSLRRRRKS